MRKSIILASLLFVSSSYAVTGCQIPNGYSWAFVANDSLYAPDYACDTCGSTFGCTAPNLVCYADTMMFSTQLGPMDDGFGGEGCGYERTIYIMKLTVDCLPEDGCLAGVEDKHAWDGDEAGCNNAGGYYMANGNCNTLGEAISQIFTNPTAVKGALLTIGGVAFGGAGIVALPVTGGGSAFAVSAGGLAAATGLGMMGFSAGDAMFNSTVTPPSNDVTNGEQRIKISLKSVTGGGEASVLTNSNTTTGKVEQATYIPPATKAALSDANNVNDDGTLKSPISLSGVQSTTYDYVNNTATTVTHEASSTSSAPVTSTKTTTITVTQNPDGSTTTNSSDPSVAPSVTGSGGGSLSSSSSSSSTGWGTGAGSTSGAGNIGTGQDYTGVLNDIKKNTGDTAGFLSDIKGFFNNDTEVNTALSDGSDGFGGYQGDIEGSFAGFIYTDPLGLNNIAGGSSIPEYGFTIMGTHFTIMDQALLNQLPLDLLRGLFLFMAALAGFITVFSGV